MIFTFYSYKGGVGRSMALANVAKLFYDKGLSVIMIDWDLEAPGLESFFLSSEEDLRRVRSRVGLIDILMYYKNEFPHLPLEKEDDESSCEVHARNLATLSERLSPISLSLCRIYPEPPKPDSTGAQSSDGQSPGSDKTPHLSLLPAGWRAGDRFALYAREVQSFDWPDFYVSYAGELYFDWLRRELESQCDLVLIDSRTGVTEMGGVCSQQLADVVVSMCAPNSQNLAGVTKMAVSFTRNEIRKAREKQKRSPLEVIVVPARLDITGETLLQNNFRDDFIEKLEKLKEQNNLKDLRNFNPKTWWELLKITYITAYAYKEKMVIGDPNRNEALEKNLKDLATYLASLAPAKSKLREAFSSEISLLFGALPRPVPAMAPPLPEGYVSRPQLMQQLLGSFLTGDAPIANNVALYGLGGSGKTALAAALCQDSKIITAFKDGILWTSLGKHPNIKEELTRFFVALSGVSRDFVDESEALDNLKTVLSGRDCLMVVNDVWDGAHLQYFLQAGDKCARLITTRNQNVALNVTNRIRIGEVSPEEAVKLLIGEEVSANDREPLQSLALSLSNWPLALKLTGALLRKYIDQGETVEAAVAHVRETLALGDVTAFDQLVSAEGNQTIVRAIESNLEGLEDQQRALFHELGILPEGVSVPLTVVAQLWGLDNTKTKQVIERLSDLSLVSFDLQAKAIRLHSLIRSYLATRLSDEASGVHGKLVSAWGDLHNLPDEYAWKWLGYHMVAAKQEEPFSLLLQDFDWLQAKLKATDAAALIADYELLPNNETLTLIRGAIQLSAHILDDFEAPPNSQEQSGENTFPDNRTQLAGQLLGRLSSFQLPGIHHLLDQAANWRAAPWLRPLTSSLTRSGGPLICTMRGHTDEVTAIALTRDGQKIVTGSTDTTLKVWKLGDSRELFTLRGHLREVTSVVVTHDGKHAISGSLSNRESARELSAPEQTLIVWDVETGTQLRSLRGHNDDVTVIALTPNGDRLVTGSADTTIKVWDFEAGKELLTLRGHTQRVTGLAITSDGSKAISGSLDRSIKVWDLETGALLRTLSASRVRDKGLWLHLLTAEPNPEVRPNNYVGAIALTPDGQRVVSSASDRTMKIWELDKDTMPGTLSGHKDHICALAALPDGKRVISASLDRTLKVWDLESRKCISTLNGHTARVRSVAVTPNGAQAISGSKDKRLKVWSLERSTLRSAENGHRRHVSALAVAPDGETVISGSYDRSLRVWNTKTGEVIKILLGHKKEVTGVAVTPDGKRLVSTSHDYTVKVWDLERGEEVLSLAAHNSPVLTVVIDPIRAEAVSISEDGATFCWDLNTWKIVHSITGDRPKSETSIAILDMRNLTTLVRVNRKTGVVDGIYPSERINSLVLPTIITHARRITRIAITPDEHEAITGSRDGTVRVWDWSNGELLHTLPGHLGTVTDLVMTHDGRSIVTSSKDCTLKIWDLGKRTPIATFTGDSELRSCAITPDAATIIAGEESGRMHFLRLEGV